MPLTIGALILTGAETLGATGATAWGASTAFTVAGTAITGATIVGTTAIVGAPIGLMTPLRFDHDSDHHD
jgi:hypothetical protein